MKPLRKYAKATIWFRDHVAQDGEYFEVCVYSSVVIYFDERGKEHTVPMVFVKEVIEYAEDRVKTESATPEQAPVLDTTGKPKAIRSLQSPKSGKAFHV